MPTYEYKCEKCGFDFEVFQQINADPLKKCPKCKGKVKKVISGGAGLIFKGSGFYVNDYKKSSACESKSETASQGKGCEKCCQTPKGCPNTDQKNN